jgi:GNAT superfamily N-acetyltransferase
VVADPVLLIERLAANAWPAATVQVADGWLLRHTPGVARRRSNSALPPPSAAAAGPARRAQALEVAERFYARRNQAALVQVSPAELHGRLDHELAARGYDRQAPTVVSTAPIDRLLAVRPPAPILAVSVGLTASPRWLTAWTEMEDRPDAEATGQLVLARIAPRTGFLTATHDDQVLGVGMLVVERGWAGVFCMATRPDHRRRGVATAVLAAGARWAAGQGARHLYLQVELHNLPALRLYDRLGFHPSHHYHYRVAAMSDTPAHVDAHRPQAAVEPSPGQGADGEPGGGPLGHRGDGGLLGTPGQHPVVRRRAGQGGAGGPWW